MKLTRETDYAFRLLQCLSRHGDTITGAETLSGEADVPLRFTLKILRKLSIGGLVRSKPGISGGYRLALPPDRITLLSVLRLTEGEPAISRCLEEGYVCEHGVNHGPLCERCGFHQVFCRINSRMTEEFEAVTLDMIRNSDRIPGADAPSEYKK